MSYNTADRVEARTGSVEVVGGARPGALSIRGGDAGTWRGSFTPGPATDGGFSGCVLMPNGKVCLVPDTAAYVGIYDPSSNTYTNGPIASGFSGGVLLPNGKVCLIPTTSGYVGIYDPVANTYASDCATPAEAQYQGGVLLPSGKVCMVPWYSAHSASFSPVILVYDPATHSITPCDMSADVMTVPPFFSGGVLLPDGKVCLVTHYNIHRIYVYNPGDNTYTRGPYVPDANGCAFSGGVLLSDGKVCLVPHDSTNVCVYDPTSNTLSAQCERGGGWSDFAGGVLMPNGKVCFVPHSWGFVSIYDPVTNTYTNGPAREPMVVPKYFAYSGGVMLPNGKILFANKAAACLGLYDTGMPTSLASCLSPHFNKF
jgi:hypothetical protein